MRKLITLSDELNAELESIRVETHMPSLTAVFALLALAYRQGQKKPVGRPRGSVKEDLEQDDDGVARYQSPDYPKTKSRYTKAEVDGWYDFRGLAVPPDAYKVHPDVEG